MSKILSILAASALLCSTAAIAQDFTVLENPVQLSTSGNTPFLNEPFESKDFVLDFKTYVKNISENSNDSIQIEWTYLPSMTVQPTDWKVIGICDNILCRSEDGAWFSGTTQTSNKFDNAHNMLLEVNIYAPTTAPDGVGTYHVEVKTPNQTDTVVFILTKQTTGISGVAVNDQRIALYPNPATDVLNIFADNKLNVSNVSVYNIIGKEMTAQAITKGQEVSTLNLNQLSPGLYLVRFSDEKGNIVSTRRLTKK